MSGAQVFNAACYLCHSAPGVGGAPVVGDAAAWEARIAQGAETLNNHALNGFQGAAGFMPAKGGRVDLSDAEITSAVEYMIEQAAQ
jgi:cytochrome c5